MKKLIAFYSRAGENYFGGSIKSIKVGNTEKVADILKDLTNADLYKIEQKVPYDDNYRTCVKQASEDFKTNARPELINVLKSIDEYDEIYLGYPNYCGTMPMAVYTFLESYDFSNKVIHPFCTNEGSGLSNSEDDILKTAKNAVVTKGLSIIGSKAKECENLLKEWIK